MDASKTLTATMGGPGLSRQRQRSRRRRVARPYVHIKRPTAPPWRLARAWPLGPPRPARQGRAGRFVV